MKNPRETAWRVFASELNSAEYEIKAEEEKKPSYQLSRLGAIINRVLVAGVLTEKENVGNDAEPMWRGRIADSVGGSFYINVGKYQPEAAAAMTGLEVPCLIAVVGKVKSYTTDEGRTWVSIRPERVVQIDDATRDEWLLDAAKSTWKRLVDMKKAFKQEDRSVDGLMASGLGELSARGIALAIEQYGMPDSSAHLKSIQEALRSLLPDKNVDLGLPEELADSPEEVEFDQGTGSADDADDKEAIIMQLLEDLDVDNKGAPRDQLEEQAAAKGISPMELEEISSSLMDKGLVYEPNLRYLKRI